MGICIDKSNLKLSHNDHENLRIHLAISSSVDCFVKAERIYVFKLIYTYALFEYIESVHFSSREFSRLLISVEITEISVKFIFTKISVKFINPKMTRKSLFSDQNLFMYLLKFYEIYFLLKFQ